MNEPIVSPWLIYWIGRLDIIHGFCCIVGFFLTVIAFFGWNNKICRRRLLQRCRKQTVLEFL